MRSPIAHAAMSYGARAFPDRSRREPFPPETLHLTDERYDLSAGLDIGMVGTVVEVYPADAAPSACLVEFSDVHGRGYAFATVLVPALLVLHYIPSESNTAQVQYGVRERALRPPASGVPVDVQSGTDLPPISRSVLQYLNLKGG